MIHVIAAVEVQPGKRQEYLDIFKELVPKVRAEDGCIAYGPAVDVDSGIGLQMPLRGDVVTVIEQWSDVDALKAHIAAPHMEDYKNAVEGIVTGLTLQVLEPA